jgi:hypothetical protein
MMTRRGVLVESLKYAGLFAGAAVVFGCGNETGGTQSTGKPAQETLDMDKKQAEAREKAKADAGKTK